MMDPITALGVAGNIVQFIDFGLKAVSKAREIHSSSTGALLEHVDLEVLTEDITAVTQKLLAANGRRTGSDNLDKICERCIEAGKELLVPLNGMRLHEKSKWKSVRQALKATWGKTRVEELKKRLEEWRNEVQFHVMMDLRSTIDIEFTKQSERFRSLDDNARAIFEALSINQTITLDVVQSEFTKSANTHQQAMLTILRTHGTEHAEVKQSLNALDDHAKAALQAIAHNQTSIQEAGATILSNQDESNIAINQALETMNASSQAEHEATRRELEQMKQAMAQIERDMVRRDQELKELLIELGKTSTEKERKKLQEKSNAVSVALCALVTIYQGLQKMILGIQAQAKLILTSANLGQLWNEISLDSPSIGGGVVQLRLLDALVNKPPDCLPSSYDRLEYISQFELRYGHFSTPLNRTLDDLDWIGLGIVDYHNIANNSGLNPVQVELAKKEVRMLLEVLHTPVQPRAATKRPDDPDEVMILGLLKSMILISTILVQCLNPVGATKVIDAIDTKMRASPRFAERQRPRVLRSRALGDSTDRGDDEEEEVRPAILFRRLLRHVTVWSTVGKLAGIQRIAELHLRSRIARWDASKSSMLAPTIIGPQRLFEWLILKPEVPEFLFDIGATEAGRARGAVVYAIVEFLVTFGFCLMTPTIEFGPSGLYARVARLSPEGKIAENQLSIEEVAKRLFKPNFLNR